MYVFFFSKTFYSVIVNIIVKRFRKVKSSDLLFLMANKIKLLVSGHSHGTAAERRALSDKILLKKTSVTRRLKHIIGAHEAQEFKMERNWALIRIFA